MNKTFSPIFTIFTIVEPGLKLYDSVFFGLIRLKGKRGKNEIKVGVSERDRKNRKTGKICKEEDSQKKKGEKRNGKGGKIEKKKKRFSTDD